MQTVKKLAIDGITIAKESTISEIADAKKLEIEEKQENSD